jgi:hypothetical protein
MSRAAHAVESKAVVRIEGDRWPGSKATTLSHIRGALSEGCLADALEL